jgi:hypothetical protein
MCETLLMAIREIRDNALLFDFRYSGKLKRALLRERQFAQVIDENQASFSLTHMSEIPIVPI